MIRVCPLKDARCPHGMSCSEPCAKDRYYIPPAAPAPTRAEFDLLRTIKSMNDHNEPANNGRAHKKHRPRIAALERMGLLLVQTDGDLLVTAAGRKALGHE